MYEPRRPEPNPQYDRMSRILNWITGCIYRKSALAQGDHALRLHDLTGIENHYIRLMEHLEGAHPSELLADLFEGWIQPVLKTKGELEDEGIDLPDEYDYAFLAKYDGHDVILALISDRMDVQNIVAGCYQSLQLDEDGNECLYTLEKIFLTQPEPGNEPNYREVHSDFAMTFHCSANGMRGHRYLPRQKAIQIYNDFTVKDPQYWEREAKTRDYTHKRMATLLHEVLGTRGKVLDYGGGTGLVPEHLITQHPASKLEFDVVDPSEPFTTHLRGKKLKNVREIIRGLLFQNLYPGNFEKGAYDALVSNGTFEYGTSLIDVCRLAQDALKDDGRLFLSFRIPRNGVEGSRFDVPGHRRLYQLSDGQALYLTSESGFGLPDGVLLDEGYLKAAHETRFTYPMDVIDRVLSEHGFVIAKEVQSFGYNSFRLGHDPHHFRFLVAERA